MKNFRIHFVAKSAGRKTKRQIISEWLSLFFSLAPEKAISWPARTAVLSDHK
jgi:hypothetical protein